MPTGGLTPTLSPINKIPVRIDIHGSDRLNPPVPDARPPDRPQCGGRESEFFAAGLPAPVISAGLVSQSHMILIRDIDGEGKSGVRAPRRLAGTAALFLLLSLPSMAAPPVVTGVDVRGLQIGKPTTLVIKGTDLLPNPRLLTTARVARQTLKEGAKPDRIELEVELAPGSQPGFENWWLVTDNGISARDVLATDRFPQKSVGEKTETVPVAIHGALAGSEAREVTFSGKAGQEIICEVEAQRIGSKLRPVLKLFGPGNRLLNWSQPMLALRGDTRIEVKLPADGEYRVTVNDLLFAADAPGHYRLRIGKWSYADLVFPSTVQRGASAEAQVVGPVGETRTVRLPSNAEGTGVPAPWADPETSGGPQAVVWLSDLPELVEQRSGSMAQVLPAPPVAVNGRIGTRDEEDAYELTVNPGSEVEIEVFADSLGSPIDASLELRDLKGTRLAFIDDSEGRPDPRLAYKVPAGVTKVVAVVRNVNGSGGPRSIYRMQVKAKGVGNPVDFSLALVQNSHALEAGGASVFKVEAVRGGYDGPIELAFDHLPAGLKVSGEKIPPQATATLLVLSSEKPLVPAIVTLKGRGNGREVLARFSSPAFGKFQPWLDGDLAFAGVAGSGSGFGVTWGKSVPGRKMFLGGKLSVPVTCVRTAGHDGPVRLTLLTSQGRPFVNGVVDQNRLLREEKAVIIAEDKPAQKAFDAVTAAAAGLAAAQAAGGDAADAGKKNAQIALDATRKAADEAAKQAKNDVDVSIIIPPDLPEIMHQIAFKAELLKRDGRTVEAVAYTPVLEIPVENALVVKLTPPAPVKLDKKAGATLELSGQVERREGAAGEVAVALGGLPTGVTVPPAVTVKAGETQFKFVLTFPAAFKPGEFSGLKVSGNWKPFGPTQLKSRDAGATLKVLPADPPPEPKPAGQS